MRAISAPGKLFLSGEYAVLWGGTARLAAVGPRASAQVTRRDDRHVQLIQQRGKVVGHTTPLGVSWSEPLPDEHRFVAYAADFCLRALGRESLGFEVTFSPSETLPGGFKGGFGSSARAAVLSAEACRFILDGPFDALKVALLAHYDAQGRRGSGADVASCFVGGLIRYRRFDVEPLLRAATEGRLAAALAQSGSVDLWRIPECAFPMVYAWTGRSAHTPRQVSEVEATMTEKARQAFVERSDSFGQLLEEGLLKTDFKRVGEAVRGLSSLLSALPGVSTPGAEALLALAGEMGSVGKVSGAGGGDGCVLFAPDAEGQERLLRKFGEEGIWARAVSVESGVRTEPSKGSP